MLRALVIALIFLGASSVALAGQHETQSCPREYCKACGVSHVPTRVENHCGYQQHCRQRRHGRVAVFVHNVAATPFKLLGVRFHRFR